MKRTTSRSARSTSQPERLDAGFRTQPEWPEVQKRALIERGRRLADEELRAHGFDAAPQALGDVV